MNRSQSVKAGESIGAQTAELARQMEIPTVLSCRPNQVSRETSALRQGFFAAALLEGLRSGECTTLKSLDRFLSDRLASVVRPPSTTQAGAVNGGASSRKS